ncbi:unnamed protein product [Larinioides sclopetarius]|uniref:Peptidase M12B propeptide domain-containing protein n=1 Tax=Larinioides sclopetarius TaxID=280406 RepID=A0AAV2B3L9_9ARAC
MELSAAVLTTIFVVCSFVDGSIHRSKRQAEFFSQEVSQFHLIQPTKVTSDGQFLSNDVTHYTKHGHHERHRRSVQDDDYVHYSVHLDGLDTFLKLRPNHHLLSPECNKELGNKFTLGTLVIAKDSENNEKRPEKKN